MIDTILSSKTDALARFIDAPIATDWSMTMQTYITLTELRSRLGDRSRSAIYLDIAHGRLPQPVKLGGSLYWPEAEMEAHLRTLRGEGVSS